MTTSILETLSEAFGYRRRDARIAFASGRFVSCQFYGLRPYLPAAECGAR